MPNPGELGAARKVLAGTRLHGLSDYTGKPALPAPRYDYAAPQFDRDVRKFPFLEFSQKRRLRQVRSPPQPHRETRAAAGPIVDRDGTGVRFRDRFHKAETQPEPTP